jgi:alcohol dehydrogenase class IV
MTLMAGFEFYSVPRIVFGIGEFYRVGELAKSLGQCAMVVFNGPITEVERLIEQLDHSGVKAVQRQQRGEPVVDDVDGIVEAARREACDSVIGFGGGSAIDAAKAAAGLLANGGSAVDYMEVVGKGLKIIKPAAPWMAIPTTAGTGAEATRNAVIGLPEKQFKASIRSELLLPRVALIDPELGINVPLAVTARCGMDALCQLIESYTSTGATPMTDALALRGVSLAARELLRAYRDGHDLDARRNMALAAMFSGITLTNAGLGAVHGFAAPLGANFPAPHGAICAALLPHVIGANIAALLKLTGGSTADPTLQRYVDLGRIFLDRPEIEDQAAFTGLVWGIETLARNLGIRPLSQFGLTDEIIPAIVAVARKASSMRYNPVVLSDEELAAVLKAGIHGLAAR